MAVHQATGLDLGRLLAAFEDTPPVAAVDVLGELLAEMLGASEIVSCRTPTPAKRVSSHWRPG